MLYEENCRILWEKVYRCNYPRPWIFPDLTDEDIIYAWNRKLLSVAFEFLMEELL